MEKIPGGSHIQKPTGRSWLIAVVMLLAVGAFLAGMTATAQADDANGTSLRNQVAAAASGGTVTLSAATYTLTTPIIIDKSLTIQGAGSSATFIQSGANAAAAVSSLFRIIPASAATITFSNLTMRYALNSTVASAGAAYHGGAILADPSNSGTVLNITGCAISDSMSTYGDGGGIAVRRGTLNLTGSTISANTVSNGCGGGIFAGTGTTLTITGSTITGNKAKGTIGDGGGICLLGPGGTTTSSISNSTVSGNTADYDGGGIYTTAPLTVSSVSYSGNSAVRYASDLWNDSGTYSAGDAAPVLNLASSSGNYIEGAGAQVIDSLLTVTDGDSMYLSSATVTLGNTPDGIAESLSVNTGTTAIIATPSRGAGNSSYTLTLSQIDQRDNYQAVLRSIRYTNTSENPSTTLRTISFKVDDATQDSIVRNYSLAVAAVNDPPTVSFTQASYAATEQTNLNLHGTGITVADLDAGSGNVTATISVSEGVLNASAGTSGVSVANPGSAAVTINGTIAQVNAFLTGGGSATLVYFNGSDIPAGSVTLTVQVNDNGNSGGPPQSGSGSRIIAVTTVNDPPVLQVNAGLTLYQNGGQTAIGSGRLQLTDPDNAKMSLVYSLTVIPTKGTLKKNSTALVAGNTFTQTDVDSNSISYTPNGSSNGADSFTFTYSDGVIAVPLGPATFAITVTPVYTLSISFAGAGGNKVESTLPDQNINCLKGSTSDCSATYTPGTPVTLKATPDWKSIFTGWSGDFISSNNPGTVTMTAGKAVTATFDLNYKVKLLPKNILDPAMYLASIQDAYDDAVDGDELRTQTYFFNETGGLSLGMVSAKTVTLKGGYKLDDASYTVITGMTTVKGPLKIQQGRLNVQRLKIQ